MPPEAGIGPWTLGKDLLQFDIAPVSVTGGAGGTTWTAGAIVGCLGLVRRINHQVRYGTKDIRPITQVQENNVLVSTGNAIQLQNLRISSNTGQGNPLASVVQAGAYIQVIFKDSHEQFDGYYVITGYESSFDGMEEQIQSVDCLPIALTSRAQVTRTVI